MPSRGRWPMLMLRGTTWYYRRSVPLRIRPLFGGRSEVWKSLRTSDYEEAKLLSLRVGQEVEREFQALSKRERASLTAAQADPEAFARRYEGRALAEDAQWRINRGLVEDERLDAELLGLSNAVEDHAEALRLSDTGKVSKLLDELLHEQGLRIPAQRRDEFAHALLRARLRVLEVATERTQGDWKGQSPQNGTTVEGLLDSYLQERKLGSKSEHEVRAAYRRFSAIVGQYKLVREVTKADGRAYKESLFAAPSNRSLSRDGKLSAKSVKKLLGIVATVFRYGVSQGLLDVNPFDGLTRIVRSDAAAVERRVPYDASDLAALFGSEKFGTFTAAKRWLPLIALYTGCRMEEGGGLRVKDVRVEDGVRFFDFVPTTERGLKTASSRRRVPVHPELLRMGLLDYARTVPQDGRLFPELKPGPHGKLTGAFSKWWARFADDLGVNDPLKTFHSLRHTFKDACRRAGTSEEVHEALTGHSNGSVGRSYGLGVPLTVLAEAVAKVEYRDLTLEV